MRDVNMMSARDTLLKSDLPVKAEQKTKAASVKEAKVKKAVVDFEALFINHMLKTMRSTIEKSGLLGDGMREDVYTSLFDWEISKVMAAGPGLGLGKMLMDGFNGHEGNADKKALPGRR
ncbi:MAG: rod-binding protein [Thermodesulfobacteriota bacterium]